MRIFGKIFGHYFRSRNDRLLLKFQNTIDTINQLETKWQSLSDEALQAKTQAFKTALQQGSTIDQLLPEAFATVREASRRKLGMRHFDEQLIGGLVLHQGKIAEMKTGEGKTLVGTLPVYLNALVGKGVHVVTVNDYLAKRDAEWMQPLYKFLGLTVGVIQAGFTTIERKKAYAADITYGTNNEFGFDYLRDNMALDPKEQVQRSLHYALIDEVDSILIDESRTPLIISGPSEENPDYYGLINQLVPALQQGESADFTVDEKTRQVHLTDAGHERLEAQFIKVGLLKKGDNPYTSEHINLMYRAAAALRAHHLYKQDVDYIIQANQIVIVDEHTGRLMTGRRWSDGLHQALEAKENVPIQPENQTLASITFQNYFKLYSKLAGMTGTADTEAYEFQQIYQLEVVVVPTHKPVRRVDLPDKIYLTAFEKWEAIVQSIKACWIEKRPVLVGTASIENSELLSKLLQKEGIAHQVLNAKRHEKEANIVAEAGRPGAVTIATNMAGRGTDIVLGGNLKAELETLTLDNEAMTQHQKDWKVRYDTVIAAGGLHIIGSERHESRRIDNQLRGRAGRQGDPGSSQFFLSFEDDLLRIFAPDWLSTWMKKLGMTQGESLEHGLLNNAIENAQQKVENHHFDARKSLLEYDNVMNEQRKVMYQQRQEILHTEEVTALVRVLWDNVISNLITQHISKGMTKSKWPVAVLEQQLKEYLGQACPLMTWADEVKGLQALIDRVASETFQHYQTTIGEIDQARIHQYEKRLLLQTMDDLWQDHLGVMEHLRQGIHLRGFAQKNPKEEYKREAFMLFERLLSDFQYRVINVLSHSDPSIFMETAPVSDALQLESGYQMIGRNTLCPCGSEKKFKHCHGRLD